MRRRRHIRVEPSNPEEREGKRCWEGPHLTLDACACMARKEGASIGGNGDGGGRPAVTKKGMAQAAQVFPRRFLWPDDAARQGGDQATSGGSWRCPQRLNRRLAPRARVSVGISNRERGGAKGERGQQARGQWGFIYSSMPSPRRLGGMGSGMEELCLPSSTGRRGDSDHIQVPGMFWKITRWSLLAFSFSEKLCFPSL